MFHKRLIVTALSQIARIDRGGGGRALSAGKISVTVPPSRIFYMLNVLRRLVGKKRPKRDRAAYMRAYRARKKVCTHCGGAL
jgi:hypothetical protein